MDRAAAGKTLQRKEPVVRKVASCVQGGNPDSPATVLKKRVGNVSIELPVLLHATGMRNGNLPAVPPIQATGSAKQQAPVTRCQNRPALATGQPLLQGQRRDSNVAKPI